MLVVVDHHYFDEGQLLMSSLRLSTVVVASLPLSSLQSPSLDNVIIAANTINAGPHPGAPITRHWNTMSHSKNPGAASQHADNLYWYHGKGKGSDFTKMASQNLQDPKSYNSNSQQECREKTLVAAMLV
mgnify:CR=1 FL=1